MTLKKLEKMRIQSMEDFGFGPAAMKKIKKCPRCSTASPSEDDFCKECGSRLPITTMYDFYRSLHRICSECETVLNSDAVYCPHCGLKYQKINKSEKEDNTWGF